MVILLSSPARATRPPRLQAPLRIALEWRLLTTSCRERRAATGRAKGLPRVSRGREEISLGAERVETEGARASKAKGTNLASSQGVEDGNVPSAVADCAAKRGAGISTRNCAWAKRGSALHRLVLPSHTERSVDSRKRRGRTAERLRGLRPSREAKLLRDVRVRMRYTTRNVSQEEAAGTDTSTLDQGKQTVCRGKISSPSARAHLQLCVNFLRLPRRCIPDEDDAAPRCNYCESLLRAVPLYTSRTQGENRRGLSTSNWRMSAVLHTPSGGWDLYADLKRQKRTSSATQPVSPFSSGPGGGRDIGLSALNGCPSRLKMKTFLCACVSCTEITVKTYSRHFTHAARDAPRFSGLVYVQRKGGSTHLRPAARQERPLHRPVIHDLPNAAEFPRGNREVVPHG